MDNLNISDPLRLKTYKKEQGVVSDNEETAATLAAEERELQSLKIKQRDSRADLDLTESKRLVELERKDAERRERNKQYLDTPK